MHYKINSNLVLINEQGNIKFENRQGDKFSINGEIKELFINFCDSNGQLIIDEKMMAPKTLRMLSFLIEAELIELII